MLNYLLHIFVFMYARLRLHNYNKTLYLACRFSIRACNHRIFRLSLEPIVCCVLRLLKRIGEYNSERLNVIVDNSNCRISDLIASMVRFGRFPRCLSFHTVVLIRSCVTIYTRAYVYINAYSLKMWYCAVVDLIC